MSKPTPVAYHLRPNKAVDREVFVDLVTRIGARVGLRDFRYIGLGGPFLEDFSVLHSRTGISDLVCVEIDSDVHARQKFNAPFSNVECVRSDVRDYLEEEDLTNKRCIVWLDFTKAYEDFGYREQIDLMVDLVLEAEEFSILKITLGANPAHLGSSLDKHENAQALREYRMKVLERALGNYMPANCDASQFTWRGYGAVLLESLRLAMARQLNSTTREFFGLCSFWYADGQPMVTATGVVVARCDDRDWTTELGVSDWDYYRAAWWTPQVIDVPDLSARERIEIERALHDEAKQSMAEIVGYEIPRTNVLETLRLYYRMFPRFGRVFF